MKNTFDQIQQDTIAALRALRVVVKEVGGNYLAALQADVARIERAVAAARHDDTPDRRQLTDLRRMLQQINRLDVKPTKGRRRDLKQLDKLIEKLGSTVENWQ